MIVMGYSAYDVLLAGHARSAGLTLVTANVGEFSRVPGLNWENCKPRPGRKTDP